MKRYKRLVIGGCLFISLLICVPPSHVMAEEEESVTKEIHHIHMGNEREGGGCYKKSVKHKHTGNAGEEGGCYKMPIYHIHTGDSVKGGGCFGQAVYHMHDGNPSTGGTCYTIPVRHAHSGTSSAGGGCYQVPVYHVHAGNTESGGACYEPIYHQHTAACYVTEKCTMEYMGGLRLIRTENAYCGHHGNTQFAEIVAQYYHSACGAGTEETSHYLCWTCNHLNIIHDYQKLICTKTDNTIEGYRLTCPKGEQTVDVWQLGCGRTGETVEKYESSCTKTEKSIDSYIRNCGKNEKSVDAYAVNCGNTEETIEYYAKNCGKEEEVAYARLYIINRNVGWTADSKVLEAVCTEINGGKFLQFKEPAFQWEKDGTKIESANGSQITIKENGTYTVRLQVYNEDIPATESNISISVERIDKTAPVIEAAGYDSKTHMVSITAKDVQPDGSEGSGLAKEAYSFDGGKTWSEESQKKIDTEGNITVVVRDVCGNTERRELIIQNGEKESEKDDTKEENGGGEQKGKEGDNSTAVTVEKDKNMEKDKKQGEDSETKIKEKTTLPKKNIRSGRKVPLVLKEEKAPIKQHKAEKRVEVPKTLAAASESEKIPIQRISENKESVPIIKAAAFTLGSVISVAAIIWIIYLLFGTIRVYHNGGDGKQHYAGSCIVKKKEGFFEVTIPVMMLEQSVTGQYCLRPGCLFIGRNKGKELIVKAGDQKLSVWIDKEIPLRLPTYV